jgi:hypothetical protein
MHWTMVNELDELPRSGVSGRMLRAFPKRLRASALRCLRGFPPSRHYYYSVALVDRLALPSCVG